MMTSKPVKPLLIIETGQPVAALKRHGSFAHWIRVAAGLARDQAVAVDVQGGAVLPPASQYAGAIVTGSAAMVTERHDWSEATAAWLKQAVQDGLPVLGICYGHQLLAHALGGQVCDNPTGRQMGTVQVSASQAASDDALFGALPSAFSAQATHVQHVATLPSQAVALAHTPLDANAAFRVGEHAWGVQFHPEFSAQHMRGYVQARADALRREGTCPTQLAEQVSAAPASRRLLQRFVRLARRRG